MKLFLCGDVMTGRGVDQILRHPGDPRLIEDFITDARDYVRLAEEASGPIPAPVGDEYPWGVALDILAEERADARVINLETSVTTSDDFWPGKGINYRMHPANVGCLRALAPAVCVLANNHMLDFGAGGLADTLTTLRAAGLTPAGAGLSPAEAIQPVMVDLPGGGRLRIMGAGDRSSGIPSTWSATSERPGIHLLPDLSERTAGRVADRLVSGRRPGDVTLFSVHWGSNWGYDVPAEQRQFARWLVDAGVDLVHGHSSHHPRPFEVHRGRLILYGCGDLVSDYEGIHGHEAFRGDLSLLYFPTLRPSGELESLRVVPVQMRKLRLKPPSPADRRWLEALVARLGPGAVLA